MKIALVYFTYDKDEKLLAETITASKYFDDGNTYDIFVIDDGNHPMKNIPKGYEYKQTFWDRCENLTGVRGFIEIIKEYKAILDKGYEWVVKVDPDTWVNNLNFIKEGDSEIYGEIGFKGDFAVHKSPVKLGITECFSKLGIDAILNFINHKINFLKFQVTYTKFADDYASSIIIHKQGIKQKLLEADNCFILTYNKNMLHKDNIGKIKDLSAVSLKIPYDWFSIKPGSGEHTAALKRIKKYKKYIGKE